MISLALNQFNQATTNAGFNDIYIDNSNQLVTVEGFDCLKQLINNSIWTYLKECDFDTTLGINYNLFLGIKPVNQNIIIQQIKNNILLLNKYMTDEDLKIYKITDLLITNFQLNRLTRELNLLIFIFTVSTTQPFDINFSGNI